ncbi:acyl-CoA dehydrogenase family protein [Marinobacterium aestuariivivens]|uniref:Acyl-CoA dehydrogenase family protein n=1 Tax=Marinobacterium aestuariivivens TaxID=1698799 RepID=A0ABW1ZWE7_9GAMM
MDLTLTEEQALIQDTARRFADSELAPVAAELDRSGDHAILKRNCRQLAELGFMGLNIDSRYGGTEAGVVAFSLAVTEIARACASTAVTLSVTNMVAEVIRLWAAKSRRHSTCRDSAAATTSAAASA